MDGSFAVAHTNYWSKGAYGGGIQSIEANHCSLFLQRAQLGSGREKWEEAVAATPPPPPGGADPPPPPPSPGLVCAAVQQDKTMN